MQGGSTIVPRLQVGQGFLGMTEQGREPRDHDVMDRPTGTPLPRQPPE
jgi:hypothetical protein